MKQKLYVMALAMMGTAMSMLYSCKETGAMEPERIKPPALQAARLGGEVKVSHGWLNFLSQKAFEKVMTELHGRYEGSKGLNAWESAYASEGFQSLRRRYELIDADNSESRKAPTVDSLFKSGKLFNCPDSWFATVLNKDGNIQVGDTVYCFRPGPKNPLAYAVPVKYAEELAKGAKPESIPMSKEHLLSFDILDIVQWPDEWHLPEPTDPIVIPNLPICEYPSGNMPNWWGRSGGDIYKGNDGQMFPEHNGRLVKLNYHRWRVGFIFYASAGVRVRMLKHTRFAGWQSVTYADEMIMDACCKGKVIVPGLLPIPFNEQISPGWPGFARYAENSFEKTMKWTASGIFSEIFLEHFNFHFRVNYRGRVAERYIRQ